MRFRSSSTALAIATASALVMTSQAVAQAQETGKFTISNITDFHGRWQQKLDDQNPDKSIPGAVALKCAVDKAAQKNGKDNSIFVSSGDLIGASPFESMILDDEPTIDVMNAMGLEISTAGNHEFDKGAKDFLDRVVPESNFTWLAAGAEGLEHKENLKDYEIKELGGVKVAFIGSVTDDMPNLVSPAGIEGITWHNPVETINKIADELTEDGKADVVIAMPHEGGIPANAWSPNVDAVFMGHTHIFVNQPDSKPIVFQAGSYSQGLANLDFAYDKDTDKLTLEHSELEHPADIVACDTPYPEIQAIVDTALEKSAEAGAEVVGELNQSLYRGQNAGQESGSNRGVESQLNNLLAEVAKWSVAQNSEVTPDIGVMNAGGVRDDLEAGEITFQQAFSVQPFGNENTFTTLKGSDFVDALEQQWKGSDASRPVLSLGVSNNVSYTYDPSAPQGEHITSVTIDGEPIDPDKDYVVAGSTFLLAGGDGFEALTRGTELSALGLTDIEAFTEYLKAYLGGQDGVPAPRTGQSNVGLKFDKPLKAGQDATFDLSSLIYSQGDTAKNVTVKLGDVEQTVAIDPDLGEANYNEAGKATVTLAVPADLSGDQQLHITTDAGTDITVPVTVDGTAATNDDSDADDDNTADSEESTNKPDNDGITINLSTSPFGTAVSILVSLAAVIASLVTLPLSALPSSLGFALG